MAFFSFVATAGYGQSGNLPKELYIAANIPDSLKQDANSVLRYGMEEINVLGPGKAVLQVHMIVTVLNEKGDDNAKIILPYNKKFSSVNSFEMRVYSADGRLLKKYHKSDMYDRAAIDNESIVTDDRLLAIRHTITSYPTTIEFIIEQNIKSLINLGSWSIQSVEQSIQNSNYRLTVRKDAGFRYLNSNTNIKPDKFTAENTDTYFWKVDNLKAIKPEDGAEAWNVLPKIYFSGNSFEYYGIPGDISSWQSYGKWQQALNADVCSLSPQRAEQIQKMTADIKTDKEKAKFLYRYMQQNVRYVSIQLGIGGLKPFPASFVDEKKYGDCKALSNYMYALLKAVNIPSCYATVNAGENEEPANPEFPFDRFNHVILCVPFKGDTTWLECTSNTKPFGKLGPFTENRYALLIDNNGGKLVKTPRSVDVDNQTNREAHLIMDANGGAKAQLKISSTGEYRALYLEIASLKTDEQKEAMIRMLNIKQPSAFEFKPAVDKDGMDEVNIELDYDKFCDVSAGSKQFYRPRVFDLWTVTVPVTEKRKTAYYFEHPMQKSCVTTIDLPAGFEVETLPKDQSLKFTYGNFEIKYLYNATKNQVISTSKFILTNQVIPAAKYNEMQVYMDGIAKAQNKKLVIHKKA
ncbi:hypothetical protein BH09BAC6_BH09BAC6_03450 [soil metagenome]